jgi:ABC-type glycerol-3-phosphate transport system substrate-binding protein
MLLDVNGDGWPDTSLIECGMSPYTLWQCAFLSNGGDPSDAQSFSNHSDAWIYATSYVRQLVLANPLLVRASREPKAVSLNSAAKMQFVHDDRGNQTSFQDRKGGGENWRLFPVPGQGPIPPLDTTVIAIKRNTPAKEEAAWRFVAWLTSADVMSRLMPRYNMTPLRPSVVQGTNNDEWRFFASQIERMRFQQPQLSTNEDARRLRHELVTTGDKNP